MTHHLVGMAEIAEILGVTRQRVAQLIETYDDFPKPEVELSGGRVWSRTAVETWILSHPDRGPGRREEPERRPRFFGTKSGAMFTRFTDLARQSIVKAQEEARLMQHNFIGTEHLLLGLLALGDGVAWKGLSSLEVHIGDVRSKVLALIGRGPSPPEGHIPFTPRSKKVLEIALREALQLDHNYVGTEHVLLALVREGEGVGWQALEALGLQRAQVRSTVIETLETYGSRKLDKPVKAADGEDESCSFCGKRRAEVDKLIAGPGVYICNDCVALCDEIIEEESTKKPSTQEEVLTRIERLERFIEDLRRDDED